VRIDPERSHEVAESKEIIEIASPRFAGFAMANEGEIIPRLRSGSHTKGERHECGGKKDLLRYLYEKVDY